MKNIQNYNSKDQHHGYQEWYIGIMIFRGNFKNDIKIGYGESHYNTKTYFHIQ